MNENNNIYPKHCDNGGANIMGINHPHTCDKCHHSPCCCNIPYIKTWFIKYTVTDTYLKYIGHAVIQACSKDEAQCIFSRNTKFNGFTDTIKIIELREILPAPEQILAEDAFSFIDKRILQTYPFLTKKEYICRLKEIDDTIKQYVDNIEGDIISKLEPQINEKIEEAIGDIDFTELEENISTAQETADNALSAAQTAQETADGKISSINGSNAIQVSGTNTEKNVSLLIDNQQGNTVLIQTANGLKAETDLSSVENIVDGIDNNEKILSINNKKIQSTIKVDYDSNTKKIQLKGKNDEVISEVDASVFIKDGMVNSVALIKIAEQGVQTEVPYLKITFNLDANKEDIRISLKDFINIYDGSNIELTSSYNVPQTYSDPTSGDTFNEVTGKLVKSLQNKATLTQGEYADSALQSLNHGTDTNYINLTLTNKNGNNGAKVQAISASATIQPISTADTTHKGLLEAKDAKDYIDNALSNSDNHVSLTQAEYDALTEDEKNNGTIYLIKDANLPLEGLDSANLITSINKSTLDNDYVLDTPYLKFSFNQGGSIVRVPLAGLNGELHSLSSTNGSSSIELTGDKIEQWGQIIMGHYWSSPSNNNAVIVGSGDYDNRENIHELTWNGTSWTKQDVTSGGTVANPTKLLSRSMQMGADPMTEAQLQTLINNSGLIPGCYYATLEV